MAEEHLTRKIKRIGIAAFVVLAAALFVYFLLFRGETVAQGVSKFFAILSPILYGFVIAYVLIDLVRRTYAGTLFPLFEFDGVACLDVFTSMYRACDSRAKTAYAQSA